MPAVLHINSHGTTSIYIVPLQRLPRVLVLVFSGEEWSYLPPIWVNYSLIPDPAPDKGPERKTRWFNWSTPVTKDPRIGHSLTPALLFKKSDELSDIGNSILTRLEKQLNAQWFNGLTPVN